MTMYVLLFRQGQAAVSAILSAIGGMYEDNLYLSTLYEYLDTPVDRADGGNATVGPAAGRRRALRERHASPTRARPSRPCAT